MNTLLVVTRYNVDEMKAFAKELAMRQKLPNAGKLLVTGGYYISDDCLREIGNPLSGSYEVTELTKVQVSPDQNETAQIAIMLATFFMQRYTTAPGPWLVVDSRFEISRDNPLSVMEKIHNQEHQENTGRATTAGGGRVPIGPVLIGADVKRLKSLRSVSGESWRSRGRWVFNLCSWNQMTAEDYPFRIPTIEVGDEAGSGIEGSVLAPGDTKVVEVIENKDSGDLPISNYHPPQENSDDFSDGYMVITSEDPVPDLSDNAPASPVVESSGEGAPEDNYESETRESLLDQVHKRSGRKPHPRTGVPKLIKALRELDLKGVQE